LESKALGEIAVFIDTSGSVDQTSLAYAAAIVQNVLDECDPAAVTLYFADTEVAHSQRLEKGDPLTWEPKGGGGTDFTAVMEAIDAEGSAVCIVAISDLCGTFPDTPPSMPVIWLSTTARIAPFGETVPIDR
jgi:predicted metal-dependent peptidase